MKENNTRLTAMSEDEKIVYIVKEVFMATSPETAVTMEQIIEKGQEMGIAEDYPRGKEDGHPWYPRTSLMMGVGAVGAVMEHEEFHLHRKKVKKTGENQKGTAFVYWFDPFTKHEVVKRSTKASGTKKIETEDVIMAKPVKLTEDMIRMRMEAEPGKYRLVNGKLVLESWIQANPEKFQKLYGVSSL